MEQKLADRAVLVDRKRRRKELQEEMRALSKHKKRLKARQKIGDWPIDAVTGEKADIDPDDVMAPLPDDLQTPVGNVDEKMQALREEADQHQSFSGSIVPIDDALMVARRNATAREREAQEKIRGTVWTVGLVEARVEEAFRTLFRASVGSVGPRAFGNAMPTPVRQMSDLVAQAGNKSLRRAMQRLARDHGPPSTDEIRRMNETLAWSLEYLSKEHRDIAMSLNLSGLWKAANAKVVRKCKEIGIHRQEFYKDKKTAIKMIVEGLKRDGRAPT
jgi:hypothetical protein